MKPPKKPKTSAGSASGGDDRSTSERAPMSQSEQSRLALEKLRAGGKPTGGPPTKHGAGGGAKLNPANLRGPAGGASRMNRRTQGK
jgi:hypothetical protein